MKALTESGQTITLDDRFEIKRGGEGKILTIPERPGEVAKIYLNPHYQHMSQAQKDALSVLDEAIFVKPLELIFSKNKKREILGFTMTFLPADFVPLAAFFNKNYLASLGLGDDFKTQVARKIVAAVEKAHQAQIIIGDLSGLNVMANPDGAVRFLDVDAYETPVHSHWGLLLDEIRDYLYQGLVSQKSDFFALAVITFQLFTHLHPYKGVHQQYKALAERMMRKIPVFAPDPDLLVPKCYTPLQNPYLQKQYARIFLEGERFLLSIDQPVQTQVSPVRSSVRVLVQAALQMREMYVLEAGEFIQQASFTETLGFVETNRQFLLFEVRNQGYVSLQKSFVKQARLPGGEKARAFVGRHHFYLQGEGQLFKWEKGDAFTTIQNVPFGPTARLVAIGSVLVVLEVGFMRYLHLDQVIQNQIQVEQSPVFTEGFEIFEGLIQHVGGVSYLFFESGHTLSTVKASVALRNVRVAGRIGLATYEEEKSGENTLRYEYFALQGLQMQRSGVMLPQSRAFAYKPLNAQKGLVFEPEDDRLRVRNSENFALLAEMDCPLLSTDTYLWFTQAGIVAVEKDFCFLLNTKS
ncbi:MAG: hypothetical protein OHK0053_19480 [Microscillaceae bacterium]